MTRPLISPIRPNQIPSAARVMANDSLPRPRRRLGVATQEAENTRDAATRHFVRAHDDNLFGLADLGVSLVVQNMAGLLVRGRLPWVTAS